MMLSERTTILSPQFYRRNTSNRNPTHACRVSIGDLDLLAGLLRASILPQSVGLSRAILNSLCPEGAVLPMYVVSDYEDCI